MMAHCRADSTKPEHMNETRFALVPSTSEGREGRGVTCYNLLNENTNRTSTLNTNCSQHCNVPNTSTKMKFVRLTDYQCVYQSR